MKLVSKAVPLIGVAFALSGCVNHFAKEPDPTVVHDAIEFAQQYRDANEAGLIDPSNLLGLTPKVKTDNGARSVVLSWCSNESDVSSQFKVKMTQLCEYQYRGKMVGGSQGSIWCVESNGDFPSFGLEEIYRRPTCERSHTRAVFKVVAPEPMAPTYQWLSAAKDSGFLDRAGVKQARQAEANRQQAYIERERQQQRRRNEFSQTLLKPSAVGMLVCSNQLYKYYKVTGYVEGSRNGRLQVRLSNFLIGNQQMSNADRGQVIWTDPSVWESCY